MRAIRWVLGALNNIKCPVPARRAQPWVVRMEVVGLIERVNLGVPGGSTVWGTYAPTGWSRPNIYGQTTRHEVAVSSVSARYINAGFAWRRDDRPEYADGHQANEVALEKRTSELIEIELTAKRAPRYASIFSAYRRRLELGDSDRIAYLCTDRAARAVLIALNATPAGRDVAPRVGVRVVFDEHGTINSTQVHRPVSEETTTLHTDGR